METISITALSPAESPPVDKSIRAVVSLFWPYSSSTKQCALLLADPDFRLRNRKGQVRVRFTGASAEAVAKGKVGIGDEVVLELRGASWAGDTCAVVTPGRSIDGELVYRGALGLRVAKKANGDETDTRIAVNENTPPPEEQPEQDGTRGRQNGFANETPLRATPSYLRRSLGDADVVPIYSSPAFVKRLRLSRDKPSWDPFADADLGIEEQPNKKQRISNFGTISNWKVAERTPSPKKAARITRLEVNDETEDGAETEHAANGTSEPIVIEPSLQPSTQARPETPPSPGVARLQGDMPPPSLPRLQMPGDSRIDVQQPAASEGDGPSTPKLQPVPSSALPLPSPFPVEAAALQYGTANISSAAPVPAAAQSSESFVEVPLSGREAEVIERSGHTPMQSRRDPISAMAQEEHDVLQAFEERQQQAATSLTESLASTTEVIRDGSEEPVEIIHRERLVQAQGQRGHYNEQLTQEQADEMGSETEEDEEMYYEHLRRRFPTFDEQGRIRVDHQEEGYYDNLSDVDEDDVEEVVEDMGEPPEDDEEDEDGDEARDEEVEVLETISILDSGDEAGDENDANEAEASEDEEDAGGDSMERAQQAEPKYAQEFRTAVDDDQTKDAVAVEQPATVVPEASGPQYPMETIAQSREVDEAADHAAIQQPAMPPPKTPRVLGPPSGLFGFDGTFDAPQPKSTPRSDKDRIMAKTYSSLFGFKASPSPERHRQPPPMQTPTPASLENAPVLSPFGMAQERLVEAANASLEQATPERSTPLKAPIFQNHYPQRVPDDNTAMQTTATDLDGVQEAAAATAATGDTVEVADVDDSSLLEAIRKHGVKEEVTAHDQAAEGESTALKPEADEIAMPDPKDEVLAEQQNAEARLEDNKPTEDVDMEDAPHAHEGLQDDPVPDGVAINEELGAAIAPQEPPQHLQPPQSTAPRPSQVEVIDLGSSDDEAEQQLQQPQQDVSRRSLTPPTPETQPEQQSAHPDFSQFQPPLYSNMTQTSQGSALQSDMLDTTQTTVDRSEVQTPVAQDEDLTIPETVPDEPAPWTGPGQESFFTEQIQNQEQLAEQPGIPLTQQTNATIGDYRYFSFQSATPVATDNSDNELPPTAAPSFAQDEEEHEAASAEPPAIALETQPDITTRAQTIDLLSSSPGPKDLEDAAETNEESMALQQAARDLAQPDVAMTASEADVSAADSFSQFAQRPEDFVVVSSPAQSARSQVDIVYPGNELENIADGTQESLPEQSLQQAVDSNEQPESLLSDSHLTSHQRSSYLSPEASQHRVDSQAFETQLPPRSVLPPTPQLTQGDSLTKSGLKVVVDSAEHEPTPVETATSRRSRRKLDVTDETSQQSEAKPTPVRRSPRKNTQMSQDSHPTEEPSTPPHTRSQGAVVDETLLTPDKKTPARRSARKLSSTIEPSQEAEESSQAPRTRQRAKSTASEKELEGPPASRTRHATKTATPEPETATQNLRSPEKKTPARRSPRKSKANGKGPIKDADDGSVEDAQTEQAKTTKTPDEATDTSSKKPSRKSFRLGAVPEAISNWFSPRRSSRPQPEQKVKADEVPGEIERDVMRWHRKPEQTVKEEEIPGEIEQDVIRRHRRSQGFSTDLAYFMPLSNLDEKLNSSEKVDVLAVVTDETKAPERAKGGQRDYYTILHVTDQSLEKDESIRVEVYRPWHANLPVAQVGDVILLRAFAVKSRKRQTYLFSADSSAWCAWRYADSEAEADGQKPVWARKKRAVSFSGMKEEVKGPPVELGDEERRRAAELRDWWVKVNLSSTGGSSSGSAQKRGRSEKL